MLLEEDGDTKPHFQENLVCFNSCVSLQDYLWASLHIYLSFPTEREKPKMVFLSDIIKTQESSSKN